MTYYLSVKHPLLQAAQARSSVPETISSKTSENKTEKKKEFI